VLAVYLNDDITPKLSDQDKKAGKTLPIALPDRLDPWRIKRNSFVHKVADGTIDYEEAAEQVKQLASEGVEFAVKVAKVGRQSRIRPTAAWSARRTIFLDVAAPGQRLEADADAAGGRSLAERTEVGRRTVDSSERHRGGVGADEDQGGA
jgi:hypothetical protein